MFNQQQQQKKLFLSVFTQALFPLVISSVYPASEVPHTQDPVHLLNCKVVLFHASPLVYNNWK